MFVNFHTLPLGIVSQDVLAEKYLKNDETTIEQVFMRVAKQMASVEKKSQRASTEALFYQNMKDGAIGVGRIMSSGGTDIKATPSKAFIGRSL